MTNLSQLACIVLLASAAFAQGPPYPYTVANTWKLSTTPPALIAGQNVYRAPFTMPSTCGTWTLLTTTLLPNTATSYTDNVSPGGDGQTFCYAVSAEGTNGKESQFDVLDPVAIAPAPPTGLTSTVAKIGTQERVTFTYAQSKSPGIVWNTAYLGTAPGGPYRTLRVCSQVPTKSMAKLGIQAGTYFAVVTATAGGESGPSNETKFVVP